MTQATRRMFLQELTWEEAQGRAAQDATILFPAGSIEQHGPHLPVETDSRLVWEVATRAAARVADRANLLVAPPLYFGYSSHHRTFPGTMTLSGPTYTRVLVELCESLIRNGFRRIFILNGHGGNSDPISMAIRELRDAHDDVMLGTAAYWSIAAKALGRVRESPSGGMSHACELETSCMWHLRPELVKPERITKRITVWQHPLLKDDLLESGQVKLAFHFPDVTPTGFQGDPTLATREKGERFLELIVAEVAALLADFSRWDLRHLPVTFDTTAEGGRR
ncbi:MAG: creatininase family protein [Candidatus Methylomirabilales bacterium]